MASRTDVGRRKMTPNSKALIELRTKHAMNQEDLAGRAKISVRTIQRAESGSPIDLQTAQQIATALGVMPDAIRMDEDPHREGNLTPDEKDLARVTLLHPHGVQVPLVVAGQVRRRLAPQGERGHTHVVLEPGAPAIAESVEGT